MANTATANIASSINDKDDDDLETPKQHRERLRSIYTMYFTMFLMSLGFSLVITGVWPYLTKLDPDAGKEFVGYVIAANPFGQMLFSPLVGWWGNHRGSVRMPLIICLGFFTFASGIYSSLELIPGDRKYTMLAARFLMGVSSACIAVVRSYLSAATKLSERTKAISFVSLAQILGFAIGPGLQAVVTPFGENGFKLLGFPVNMYTAGGWINMLLGFINMLMFSPWTFKEHKITAREAILKEGKVSEEETWKPVEPDYLICWTLIWAFFFLTFNFVLLETLGTALTMDQFALTKAETLKYMGIIMSVGSIIACAMFVAIGPLCKRFPERQIMIWFGFLFMAIGSFFFIPWGPDPPILAIRKPTCLPGDGKSYSTLQIINKTELLENDTSILNALICNGTESLSNETELVGCPVVEQPWCQYTPRITFTQFIIGYVFICLGYPVGITLIQTIFSKVLGPRPQGVWMGLLTGGGCGSRVLGPIVVTTVYTNFGTYYTFGMTGAIMTISIIWLFIISDRLVPLAGEDASEKDKKQDLVDKRGKKYESLPLDSVQVKDISNSAVLLPLA